MAFPPINRFPHLHPDYLCCRGVHVKDGIQLVAFLASCLFAFCLISSALNSSPPIKFLQNVLFPLLTDLFAIILLFQAHSTQSPFLLLPFIFFQAIFSFSMAIFSILCFISFWADHQFLSDFLATGSNYQISPLPLAFIFAFCSFVSLWCFQMAIRCFRYFRHLATFKAANIGRNENAESAISRNWTNCRE